ncbi:multidrug transporter [Ureibacillus aquaedulcis]|uniref:Multidrug transporter n=1 Tax=Ureibacillus aquaedulcis TaxID=3058421 RepID=A0ABT8GSZ1_9BACL|nr:multidrug transporter [Ureibacillus sp. BA0131]MDN4494479.1 multidrug transporter [Ureibacillus sp. BA0131]
MDIEKNKPSVPHLDENLQSTHETNSEEVSLTIKETIAKNKEIIDKNRKILGKS